MSYIHLTQLMSSWCWFFLINTRATTIIKYLYGVWRSESSVIQRVFSPSLLFRFTHLTYSFLWTFTQLPAGGEKGFLDTGYYLKSVTIYPIKSCGGFGARSWPLSNNGNYLLSTACFDFFFNFFFNIWVVIIIVVNFCSKKGRVRTEIDRDV